MTEVSLAPLTHDELPVTRAWFEDRETQRWLGGVRWPEIALALSISPGRFVWLAWTGGDPVGLVDLELYDDGTAGLALTIAPGFRGRGIGAKVLDVVLDRPELNRTDVLRVGIEAGNHASIRCFEKVGFVRESEEPDNEGFVYFMRSVRQETLPG